MWGKVRGGLFFLNASPHTKGKYFTNTQALNLENLVGIYDISTKMQ